MALVDWERGLLDDVSRERLMAVTTRLAGWVRHSGTPPELEAAELEDRLGALAAAAAFDRAVAATLRPIVAAGHTTGRAWEPDPALAVPPLPLLDPVRRLAGLPADSDEARFLRVDLTRARNRVVAALEAALTAARDGLAALR